MRTSCKTLLAIIVVLWFSASATSAPLGSGFTYQGQLKQSGSPVNAICDFEFSLWADSSVISGVQVGLTQAIDTVRVSNGLFTVVLNSGDEFGLQPFSGEARYLEIAVRNPAGSGGYTTLTPRLPISQTPYSSYSLGPWTTSGNTLAYANGSVGIGTASPQTTLNVNGTSWFQGDNTPLPSTAGQGIAVGFGGDQGYIFGFDYEAFTPRNLLL